MVLNSLQIKNYRILRNLELDSLSRVSLITGRNNTGKSSILDAVDIYASRGSFKILFEGLLERGQNASNLRFNEQKIEMNQRIISSTFTDGLIKFKSSLASRSEQSIDIGPLEEVYNKDYNVQILRIGLARTLFRQYNDQDVSRRFPDSEDDLEKSYQYMQECIEVKYGGQASWFAPLNGDDHYWISTGTQKPNGHERFIGPIQCQYIQSTGLNKSNSDIASLWDNVVLTPNENYVIEALNIIEPNVDRLTFRYDLDDRQAFIKLNTVDEILPIKSMGDGINRILSIILALVNAENGFLLIDEFENGLHYSVEEKLWEIIFKLSSKLNVQVFATTHSEDCINAFETILNSESNSEMGKLIRLDNKNGEIRPVEYNANELRIAMKGNIETR
jgi:AAA15 family ATPase/GTPase